MKRFDADGDDDDGWVDADGDTVVRLLRVRRRGRSPDISRLRLRPSCPYQNVRDYSYCWG